MSDLHTVQKLNAELAQRINEEARRNPDSPYANKFVGLVNGQVVVIADDADELSRRLREIEADPRKCFCVEASRDYTEVYEIWELC
jgi:ubiquinone biosynthesis protein UbiJ